MAGNQELTNTQNQWQVLSDVMQRIWETMNGNLVAPPNFPREVIDMLDENIRIFYFDLLRLYDVTVILERAASAGSFRGFFPNRPALDSMPIASMRKGDFAYLAVAVAPAATANIWTWTEADGWTDSGTPVPTGVAAPATVNPLADNQAGQRGTNNTFALADHRHPFSPEFNQARNDITSLFNQVAQRYMLPAAGIPITDLSPELRQFILDTKGTLFFNILVNTTAAPVGARVGDYIQNQSTGERTVGNLSTYIGDVVRIVSLNPFQVVMAGNNRGPRGEQGTVTFRIVNNTTAAPAGARVNDLIMNTGTDARTVGNRTYQIGDIGEITSLIPFQVAVPGNNRGARGFPGRDALPFPTIIIGTTAEGGDGTSINCDFLCDGENDNQMFLSAINEIPATGGRILIRRGNYFLTSSLSLNRFGIQLEGMGLFSILNIGNNEISIANQFIKISYLHVNLTMRMMNAASLVSNLEISNCVFNLDIQGTHSGGILFHGGNSGTFQNIKILNNIIIGKVGNSEMTTQANIDGISMRSINGCIISGNVIDLESRSPVASTLTCFQSDSLSGLAIISNNIIEKNVFSGIGAPSSAIRCIELIRRSANSVRNNLIINNDFSNVLMNGGIVSLNSPFPMTNTIMPFIIGGDSINYAGLNIHSILSKKSTTIIIGNRLSGHSLGEVDFLVNGLVNAATIFHNAINALPENGGEIIVREGIYNFTIGVPITDRKNIIIKGMGGSTILRHSIPTNVAATSQNIFRLNGCSNITISRFFIEHNTNTPVMFFNSFHNITIEYCEIESTANICISIGSGAFLNIKNNRIRITHSNQTTTAVHFSSSNIRHAIIKDNYFYAFLFSTSWGLIWNNSDNHRYIDIINNILEIETISNNISNDWGNSIISLGTDVSSNFSFINVLYNTFIINQEIDEELMRLVHAINVSRNGFAIKIMHNDFRSISSRGGNPLVLSNQSSVVFLNNTELRGSEIEADFSRMSASNKNIITGFNFVRV